MLATAYFAESTRLASRIAEVLGRDEDAKRWQALWEDIKRTFIESYMTPTGRLVGHTQTTYVLALVFDLVPSDRRADSLRYLRDDITSRNGHLSTGFLGVGHLLPALADNGALDTAYELLLQDTFPSWLYSIKQGATTIWERWDGWTDTNGFQLWHMNSFNHYSLGSVGAWLYRDLLGVRLAAPGGAAVEFAPKPGGSITWAKGSYRSMHGVYSASWSVDGGEFTLDVDVPVGGSAIVRLPGDDGTDALEITSGSHRFTCLMGER